MKKAAAHPTTKSEPGPAPAGLGSLGVAFLDTTWRMAVPVLLFTILGILADRHLKTKPWLTLLGVVIGFVLAGYLIKRELDAVKGNN